MLTLYDPDRSQTVTHLGQTSTWDDPSPWSPRSTSSSAAGWFPRARLEQARAWPGVRSVASLYIAPGLYRNPRSGLRCEMMVLGVDPAERAFRSADLNDQARALAREDVALIDRESRPEVGPQEAGTIGECNGRRLTLVGQYEMGTGFISTGSLLVGDKTYLKLIEDAGRDRIEMGLVRLRAGASAEEAARRLQVVLGGRRARPDAGGDRGDR